MRTNEPRELQGVELGYDPRDIDLKKIIRVVIVFFAIALLHFGVGAAFFIWRGWGGATVRDARKPDFAGPKLQGNIESKVDIMTMRQSERTQMETYGINPDGKQRIPVDRALDLIAQRGLPVVSSAEAAITKGNTIEQNATGPNVAGTRDTPGTPGPAAGGAAPLPPTQGATTSPSASSPSAGP